MRSSRRSLIRAFILIALVGIWLGVSAVGGRSIGMLSQVTENDSSAFLPQASESIEAREAVQEFQDSDALPAFVTIMGADVVSEALPAGPPRGMPGAAYASDVVDGIDVDGIPLRDYLATDAVVPVIPADDGSGVLLLLPLSGEKVNAQDADGDPRLDSVVASIREQTPQITNAEVHVAGPAGFITDLGEAFSGIDGMLLLVTFAAVLVILLIVYRSIILPLLVLFSATAGLSLAGGITYLLAKEGLIQVNGQAQGILFILVVGATTDYALLVVARHREELRRHESSWKAMRVTLRACIEPIGASAGTVALGLLCLLLASLNSSRSLGPVGVIAVGSAFLAALTLLPALLLMGRWVFWPRIPRVTAHEEIDDHAPETHRSIWWRISSGVEKRPQITGAVVLVALLAGGVFVPTFQNGGTTDSDIILSEVDSKVGQAVIDEKFDLGAAEPIRIVTDADTAEQMAREVAALPQIVSADVSTDERGGRVIVDAEAGDISTPKAGSEAVDVVREVAHVIDPGSLVGGVAAENHDTIRTAQRDLVTVVPAVLIAILVVLSLLLRSIVAGALLTIATVVSFGTALGTAALVFNHVFDFPGADPTVPLLGFVFLVALGVDYSIFLMTRVREEAVAGHPTGEAVKRAMASTGGVITSAGIVLAATFAALAVLPILFLAQLAFIVSFGVLVDTFIVRTLLVPAWTFGLGRRVWWPSRLAQ